MKKFLIAVATGLLIFGGQVGAEASEVENLDVQIAQAQEMSGWTKIRDRVLGCEDKHRHDRDSHHYAPPPPPPDYYRHKPHRHGAPPPPPHRW